MAIVDKIRPETIEKLRGVIDFYLLRGILPVARAWPKKPKPPYTAIQAESMAVFGIANDLFHYLTDHIVTAWQVSSVGITPAWTDVFRSLIMKYWKIYRTIPQVAIDYLVIETDTQIKIKWYVLQRFIDPDTEWVYSEVSTEYIDKTVISLAPKPVYFTLSDDEGTRLVAPYISIEV